MDSTAALAPPSGGDVRPATRGQRIAAGALLLAAALYLAWFVPYGWVAHDEGLIGQSADQVLRGALPHVGFADAYTGGLSYLYAGVFRVFGEDLRTLRDLLYAGSLVCLGLVYALARRAFTPIGAAVATWVALAWSFPNYFAALPSWWLTILATGVVWALMRHAETGQRRYVLAAGLLVGTAIILKQTGVYLAAAVVVAVSAQVAQRGTRAARGVALVLGLLCLIAGVAVTRGRFRWSEAFVLYLPLLAVVLPLVRRGSGQTGVAGLAAPLVVAGAAALVPVAAFLWRYVVTGTTGAFVESALIAPTSRWSAASVVMRDAGAMLGDAWPLLALIAVSLVAQYRWVAALAWATAVGAPLLALTQARAYLAIWETARVLAVVVPLANAWMMVSAARARDASSAALTACAMLAFVSLNQFPFAAPIYFAYTAPLLVVAASLVSAQGGIAPRVLAPWALLFVLFAVLSLNRGYIHELGVRHAPVQLDTALNLPRAHLRLDAVEARGYWDLATTVRGRLGSGTLVAGPDCPEVYYLTGQVHPRGVMYEFLARDQPPPGSDAELDEWRRATVIVMNHLPDFSPPLSAALVARLRVEFPFELRFGRYEVRWR